MSSKLSKWLFYIPREREFSDAGFIFTYVHEHFSDPLTGGGGRRSPLPRPLWIHHCSEGSGLTTWQKGPPGTHWQSARTRLESAWALSCKRQRTMVRSFVAPGANFHVVDPSVLTAIPAVQILYSSLFTRR